MRGFGTDERALVNVLANKDPYQIIMIKRAYNQMYSRDLEKDIKSETGGKFEEGLVAIIRGPLLQDVHLLHSAISGLGTKEAILNDVLLGRSNADINAIKKKYREVFSRSLESDIRGDLSMKTERHFLIVLGASRAEGNAPVIPQAVDQNVTEIYKATEGKVGTDEMLVCSMLSTCSDDHIRAIAHAYEQKFRRSLETVIEKVSRKLVMLPYRSAIFRMLTEIPFMQEFSGHMKTALLFQLRNAVDKYMHAARLLEDAMAGMGTKDELLISRVLRYHWDRQTLANVKAAYERRFRKSLASRIKGETSGDYERLMVACVGG